MNIVFAIGGVAAAVLLGLWLRRALRSASLQSSDIRQQVNVATYRDNLDELREAHEAGQLTAEELLLARTQLERRLLDESGEKADVAAAPTPPWIAPALLALPVLLGGAIFGLTDGAQHFSSAPTSEGQAPSVEDMVTSLAARLEAQPDDVQGWAMLGRSYAVLERYPDAARAYRRANELTAGSDADLLVAEGETLGLARERDLLGRPSQLFEQALARNPDHMRALWYAGLAARQAGDDEQALAHFRRLRSLPDLPAELREILGPADGLVSAAEPPAAAAPEAADAEPTVSIRVRVELASELQSEVAPGDALFVFARARQGPPMPLAVKRLTAGELPVELVLDDSMGMVQGMDLSRFEAWTLVARISRSGEAQARAGDFEGQLPADPTTPQPVRLVIDGIVE